MNRDELLQMIEGGREGQNLEFKASAAWSDGDFQAKIIKSVLAFSNVRDGGMVVIGVEESSEGRFSLVGVQAAHLESYNEDDMASAIASFADPYAKFSLEKVNLGEKELLLIKVEEFDELPTVCKRDGRCKLRRGAIYTRTRRMPESAEVPSQTEMREILDLAMEKKLRKYIELQTRVGLLPIKAVGETDEKKFDGQLSELQ